MPVIVKPIDRHGDDATRSAGHPPLRGLRTLFDHEIIPDELDNFFKQGRS
jgi:hypothetical protein